MSWLLNPPPDNKFWTWRADMFSNEELDRIIELGMSIPSESGEAVKSSPGHRLSDIAWMEHSNVEYQWIYNTLTWNVKAVNDKYFHYDLTHIEDLQFTQYSGAVQGKYGTHIDIGERIGGCRKLSFVLQLSNDGEYTGGDLKLYFGEEATIAPREKGKLIFFPSWVLHEVTPVTSGHRLSLVGWVAGPRFK
jgi:PKHD-type hydroxylase